MSGGLRISRLSDGPEEAVGSVVVFAHNETGRIGTALASIAGALGGIPARIHVLANGCTDATVDEVRNCAATIRNLWLVEIARGDKANAWNLYIHDVLDDERASAIETHIFMDGDVTLEPDAASLLAAALDEIPRAMAAGGMPATGRDRDAWRQRMIANGMLAGNLYALRGSFVRRLRQQRVRMPIGLIGEDFLVSWLVATDIGRRPWLAGNGQCVFQPDAEFSFRSLSPARPGDYPTYLRRKWRYTLRDLQHQMLILLLTERGIEAMPVDVQELYRVGPLPSRLRWAGRDTLLRLAAMLRIRALRRRAEKREAQGIDRAH